MIIDSHVHVDETPGSPWQDPPETMIALMDEAGVEQAVVMTYCDAPNPSWDPVGYVARAIARYPSRLIGYARLDPGAGEAAREILARAIGELGFKGLKLHPLGNRVDPAHPLSIELIRVAASFGAPTLFHCGDEEYTLPLQIARAARACPEATIILGHMGGYFHVEEAIEVARAHENVVLETSAMPYPEAIRRAVEAIGADRVIYASDGPGCPPLIEMHKVRLARVGDAAEEKLFGGTIARILAGVKGGAR